MWLYILYGILVVAGFGSLLLLDHTARKLRKAERGVEILELKLEVYESKLKSSIESRNAFHDIASLMAERGANFDAVSNRIYRQAQRDTSQLWSALITEKIVVAKELSIGDNTVISNCLIVAPMPFISSGSNGIVTRCLVNDNPLIEDLQRILTNGRAIQR